MLRQIFLMALLLLMIGCIDPINLKNDEQKSHLVVESTFTNDPEHNYVRLTYSLPYTEKYRKYEKEAGVSVHSDKGEVYAFAYDAATNNYYPIAGAAAFGTPGHKYILRIQVGENVYQSGWITMKQPVPIDTVHFEIDEQLFAFKGDRQKEQYTGYRVLVDYQDPAEEQNFLRWSFFTEFEVATQPWDYVDERGVARPKNCCAKCLLTEKLDRFKVIDDRLTNGKYIINQEVLFMPFHRYLGVKNKLKVFQYSVTEEVYEFYRIMEQQKEATGTVFDPPPARVTGNVSNINNKDEQVIGFFDVASVVTKQVTILRNDIDHRFLPYKYPDDCRVLPNATSRIPEDW
ncbi:DUF4249 domain-containing protein [Pontibacter cellulosilyticus]|uniref:DUF4249 domain-containing protein n=1 Tax=Pontibacter cellulosilyticus TaxID=1720253 RepID=A0A923SLE0_9BACT|nr:DUF4249 domain-containing protein [Pontibacter cellulosilyticus]MBC5994781.1 DUF4249 domain-containing protein [Pontibacter cellulosilyticus]